MQRIVRRAFSLALIAALGACGTTYQVTEVQDTHSQKAAAMFAEEKARGSGGRSVSRAQAKKRFERVARRVEPVAEKFCREQNADKPRFTCDVAILVDPRVAGVTAFQSYARNGQPVIVFSELMLREMRNDDEIAFVIGHEVGHHIGQHILKGELQELAGGLLLGQGGAILASQAFSQTYELESDVIGTYIASMAGYDPIRGARYFAIPTTTSEKERIPTFLDSHPPDAKRLATVIATAEKIKNSGNTLARTPRKPLPN